jgi:hypothetical protein
MTSLTIKPFPGWRSRAAALLALVAGASAVAIGLAVPANASTCTPLAGLAECLPAYQVTGTPDNSLVEWGSEPGQPGSFTVGSVPNGTTLYVICQANDGPQQDGEYNAPGVPSQTYDLVYDPALSQSSSGGYAWVYDWWMNTPPQQAAYNWYSWPDRALHCNFNYATTT